LAELDNISFTTFHVVKRYELEYTAIVGNNILQKVDILLSTNGIRFIAKTTEAEFSETFKAMCVTEMIEKQSVVDRIGLSHLDSLKKLEVEKLIRGYEPKQTIRSPVEMEIIFQHPRRTSYENRVLIDKQVQEWLDAGIVIPSCSEYASPVVLVSKKDGSKRFCCD